VRIDLNADVGESFGAWRMGDDGALLRHVSSVNVACGFHAGDPLVMDRTVEEAARAGVAVGAHPGHFDLRGFGRRAIPADAAEVERDVLYQVGALMAFTRAHGVALVHVKPHGALYNQAAADERVARAVARGVARAGRTLVLVGLATTDLMRRAAEAEGLPFAAEAFADRAYADDGTLLPRSMPGALLQRPEDAAAQAVHIAREGTVLSAGGRALPLRADTLCLHGDHPRAAENARAVRAALESAGVTVRPLGA
jgi:5-oxoprolinase (ATP-hydrolysing) subunit A